MGTSRKANDWPVLNRPPVAGFHPTGDSIHARHRIWGRAPAVRAKSGAFAHDGQRFSDFCDSGRPPLPSSVPKGGGGATRSSGAARWVCISIVIYYSTYLEGPGPLPRFFSGRSIPSPLLQAEKGREVASSAENFFQFFPIFRLTNRKRGLHLSPVGYIFHLFWRAVDGEAF